MTNAPSKKKILIIIICVLVAALAVTAFVYFWQPDDGLVLEGVTVAGVDISGMTKDEALAAASKISADQIKNTTVTIDFDGTEQKFSGEDLGLITDYEDAVNQAYAYGRTGGFFERRQQTKTAEEQGIDFPVTVHALRESVSAALLPLKEKLDTQPVEASFVFSKRGFLADGTPYEPDEQAIIESCADGDTFELPSDLMRVPDAEKPNKLRYEFWQNDHYVENYIPVDADISRFLYTGGTEGHSIDMETVIDNVVANVEKGDYSTIVAPVQAIAPTVTVDDLKKNTQLIASWTSSYSNHAGYNRNWNVTKLSSIINGVIMQPGEEWSINEEAGVRTVSAGWKEAAGIVNGGYVQQAGGGVCQISSTLYNAAIRSALEITDSTHHSIQSDYIPLGLDATISSGGPDLKIKNPNSVPVYVVSYVNPKDQNVTVEIYGPTVVNATYGDVILDFSFENGGSFGTPGMEVYYNTAVAPDNTPIAPNASYVYAKPREGKSVETFIHYLSADGTELGQESFHSYKWAPINGKTYVNAADPATGAAPAAEAPPAPTPTPAPEPTAPVQ